MTAEQICIQSKRLVLEEQLWRANMEIGEIVRNCKVHVVIKGRLLWSPRQRKVVNTHEGLPNNWNGGSCGVSCAVCGQDLGWWCPKNPKGYCEYDDSSYGNCKHCGQPDERK